MWEQQACCEYIFRKFSPRSAFSENSAREKILIKSEPGESHLLTFLLINTRIDGGFKRFSFNSCTDKFFCPGLKIFYCRHSLKVESSHDKLRQTIVPLLLSKMSLLKRAWGPEKISRVPERNAKQLTKTCPIIDKNSIKKQNLAFKTLIPWKSSRKSCFNKQKFSSVCYIFTFIVESKVTYLLSKLPVLTCLPARSACFWPKALYESEITSR